MTARTWYMMVLPELAHRAALGSKYVSRRPIKANNLADDRESCRFGPGDTVTIRESCRVEIPSCWDGSTPVTVRYPMGGSRQAVVPEAERERWQPGTISRRTAMTMPGWCARTVRPIVSVCREQVDPLMLERLPVADARAEGFDQAMYLAAAWGRLYGRAPLWAWRVEWERP